MGITQSDIIAGLNKLVAAINLANELAIGTRKAQRVWIAVTKDRISYHVFTHDIDAAEVFPDRDCRLLYTTGKR